MNDAPAGWLDGLSKAASIIGGGITSAGAIAAVLIWLSGGFEPGTKIMADKLSAKITDLQGQLSGLGGTIKSLQERIDAMPRSADIAAQADRVSRLEGVLTAFGDRLGRDEVDAARVSTRVDRLEAGTGALVRAPH